MAEISMLNTARLPELPEAPKPPIAMGLEHQEPTFLDITESWKVSQYSAAARQAIEDRQLKGDGVSEFLQERLMRAYRNFHLSAVEASAIWTGCEMAEQLRTQPQDANSYSRQERDLAAQQSFLERTSFFETGTFQTATPEHTEEPPVEQTSTLPRDPGTLANILGLQFGIKYKDEGRRPMGEDPDFGNSQVPNQDHPDEGLSREVDVVVPTALDDTDPTGGFKLSELQDLLEDTREIKAVASTDLDATGEVEAVPSTVLDTTGEVKVVPSTVAAEVAHHSPLTTEPRRKGPVKVSTNAETKISFAQKMGLKGRGTQEYQTEGKRKSFLSSLQDKLLRGGLIEKPTEAQVGVSGGELQDNEGYAITKRGKVVGGFVVGALVTSAALIIGRRYFGADFTATGRLDMTSGLGKKIQTMSNATEKIKAAHPDAGPKQLGKIESDTFKLAYQIEADAFRRTHLYETIGRVAQVFRFQK